jgi:8-amino-7-oxononanoate synthase
MTPTLQPTGRTEVRWRGKRLVYFGGCDYFRLASHPAVWRALRAGLNRFGLGVSASRLTTGNHELYEQLEARLADFFGVGSATLAGNGSAPNLMVTQALAGQFTHALMDERAHGSLVDAALMLDCPVIRFKHRDAADLARVIRRLGSIRPLVLTDGMFSHDGGVAPLKEYLALLPRGAMLLVDDAHGAGGLGEHGRGTPEHAGVRSPRIIQTITLSKAFGVYGGAVLGTRKLQAAIHTRSRAFVGSTPLPLPLAAAAIKSVAILKSGYKLRARLRRNTERVREQLRRNGIPCADMPGPIISLIPRNARESARLWRELLKAGIHPPLIHYPGGPEAGYYRFAISSEHTVEQLDGLARALVRGWRT